jgi:MFS family permease
MMLLWGLVMTFHGVIKNYGGLITVRVLLGATEAGLYPGIVFYITSWYKRSEMGTRVAVFFSSATVAGAFSGLLAAAISKMDGIGGRTGWEWIFILEGLATIVLAVASFWVIQDFPNNAKFLTEDERKFVIRRLKDDQKLSADGESFHMKYVWQSLTDWKTYVAMGIYMGFDGPLYAFSLFLPSIINQLGFKATEANLLSVPVYAWGCLMTCVIGFLGDRIGNRSYINFALFGVGLAAYIILIVSRSAALSYFAVYLAVSAIYPIIPNSVAWVASNVEGSYKRAVTLAIAIGFGNINGAVTANIYRSRDKPRYVLGHAIVLAYIAIGLISSIVFFVLLKRENARRDRGERDEVIRGVESNGAGEKNGVYANVEEAQRAKGDAWSGFRYTL